MATLVLAPPASAANGKSPVLAGYSAQDVSGFLAATGKFKIPTITCPASGTQTYSVSVLWVGSVTGGKSINASLTATIGCSSGAQTVTALLAEQDAEGYAGKFITA